MDWRGRDAVDRRDEGDSDSGAELGRIGEVLHDLDQAEHRTEDTYRRRVTTRYRFPHPRRELHLVPESADLDLRAPRASARPSVPPTSNCSPLRANCRAATASAFSGASSPRAARPGLQPAICLMSRG